MLGKNDNRVVGASAALKDGLYNGALACVAISLPRSAAEGAASKDRLRRRSPHRHVQHRIWRLEFGVAAVVVGVLLVGAGGEDDGEVVAGFGYEV